MKFSISDEAIKRAKRAIKQLAKEHGVSEAEVRKEMREAMLAGTANPDPAVQARWASIQWCGEEPTVEEFIACMTEYIEARKDEENFAQSNGKGFRS